MERVAPHLHATLVTSTTLPLNLEKATSLPSMSFADRSWKPDMARGATVQARRDARAETREVRGACASAVRAERRLACITMRAAR